MVAGVGAILLRHMAFKAVEGQKMFVRVAAQIQDAIERGEYAPGAMLPSERDLCRQMNVSRPVLRQAMSALQVQGVVRTRAGLGSFVREEAPESGQPRLPLSPDPMAVMELRLILEPAGARLAAARFAPERAAGLERLLDELREAAHEQLDDLGRFARLDLRFHQSVAEASGNPVLGRFVSAVVDDAGHRLRRSLRDRTYRYSQRFSLLCLEHHERLYVYLTRGAEEQASQAMFRHLLATQSWLQADGEHEAWEQAHAALLASLPSHVAPGSPACPRPPDGA